MSSSLYKEKIQKNPQHWTTLDAQKQQTNQENRSVIKSMQITSSVTEFFTTLQSVHRLQKTQKLVTLTVHAMGNFNAL